MQKCNLLLTKSCKKAIVKIEVAKMQQINAFMRLEEKNVRSEI